MGELSEIRIIRPTLFLLSSRLCEFSFERFVGVFFPNKSLERQLSSPLGRDKFIYDLFFYLFIPPQRKNQPPRFLRSAGLICVRPAWVLTNGWKSLRENHRRFEVEYTRTASKIQGRFREKWSEGRMEQSQEAMNKNRIQGLAFSRVSTRWRWRVITGRGKCGVCLTKVNGLIWGDLEDMWRVVACHRVAWEKGNQLWPLQGVSRSHSSQRPFVMGRTGWRAEHCGEGLTGYGTLERYDEPEQGSTLSAWSRTANLPCKPMGCDTLSTMNRRMRSRMSGGVGIGRR